MTGELDAVAGDARQLRGERIDRAADRGGRRVDLVGDAGDEQAEPGHPLRQHELRLGLAEGGERAAELAVDRGELCSAEPDLALELFARAAAQKKEDRERRRGEKKRRRPKENLK